ncbi:MAG: arginine--tRNA ligase [Thermoguttaceae bacterium]|jgi:arginyl-tRNA synthetase
MNILTELKSRFRTALTGLIDSPDEFLDQVRPSQDPKFGDYQANLAMSLGKQLKRPPRNVAADIVRRLDVADICQPLEIAGPGFINLRLKNEWLVRMLNEAVGDPRLGIARVERKRTFVIDYSAPNVAKPMHVGHIRSTVIGDALCRTLDFLGHRAISDNHIGDWGTQFGMILYGYKQFLDKEAYKRKPVEELARLYRLVRQIMEYQEKNPAGADAESEIARLSRGHPDINAAVLVETAKLHAGDAENRRLWEEFLPFCEDEINRVYNRLNVHFDHTLGESFYEDRLAAVVDELMANGIARESDGAICIFFPVQEAPMIVRKQDGAFLYATTDLATIRYRMETWQPDAILYVVDHRQSLHFQQLFQAAKLWGYGGVELQHVIFGTVLGEDGRPFKTRSGDTVGLESLLDEAVRRAAEIVAANDDAKPDGPEISSQSRAEIAECVGIAALKYADLSQNRTSDYVFSYDKMLAMNGNTATYMQYAYARVRSIFAKGNVDAQALRSSGAAINLTLAEKKTERDAERALALELLRFAEALDLTAADYRPNQLTAYLFELANRYSTFFEQCHVLRAESELLRQSRLLLCDLTARTIQKGLQLLGIKVVEKM